MRPRLWAANAPITPSTAVASARGSNQGSATRAASPAPTPKMVPCTRTMAYTPTLVMRANKAATGALAAA